VIAFVISMPLLNLIKIFFVTFLENRNVAFFLFLNFEASSFSSQGKSCDELW